MDRTGHRQLLVLLALFSILVSHALALECPVSIRPSANIEYPDISGDRIVWYNNTETHDIVSYNFSLGTEERLISDNAEKLTPLLGDSFIAWMEVDPLLSTVAIALLDFQTGAKTTLVSDPLSHAVSGDLVVWKDLSNPDIGYYNTSSQIQGILVNTVADRTQPAISGGRIVWVNGSCSDVPGCTSALFLKDINTGIETRLVADTRDRASPAISGNEVAWADNRAGTSAWQVYLIRDITNPVELQVTSAPLNSISSISMEGDRLVWSDGIDIFYNDTSGTEPPRTISSGGTNDLPRISGNRVVWQKKDGGNESITLYTIDPPPGSSCPVANFSADLTSGSAPLAVQFTDRSEGTPTHWYWDFGDGNTSQAPSPSHTYLTAGIFPVTLTVSNDFGRDIKTGTIYTNTPPTTSFKASPVSGINPLEVSFFDTSNGAPTTWSWDFENDLIVDSHEQNPVHLYDRVGNYTVNLTTANTYGSNTDIATGLIWVMNGMNATATTTIDGLDVRNIGGAQHFTLDTTKVVSNTTGNTTWLSFQPQGSTGWQNITFISRGSTPFQENPGRTIEGDIGSAILESREIVPSMFLTGIGNNLPVSYRLELSSYPVGAEINATIWEGVTPADERDFRRTLAETSPYFTNILDTAYTLVFVSTNLNPQDVTGATLNLSVSGAWVRKNGNENNITVIRLGGDGIDEVLNPSATFTDAASNLDFFSIPSPHGLSRFGLVSATGSSNLLQMGTRLATQLIQGSGAGTGHSSNDYIPQETSAQPAPERPVATFYGEGKLETTPAGATRDSVIISSPDHGASLFIGAGTETFDGAGHPLTLVTAEAVPGGSIPPVPAGAAIHFTGVAYDLRPDGATFDPPATLSFTVPGNLWSPETRYSIQTYSVKTGSWYEIPSRVEPASRTVSGKVSHLCLFGLFAAVALPAIQAPATAAPVTGPPKASPLPRTPMGTFTGMMEWLYATGTAYPPVSLTILVGGLVSLYAFSRRIWLARYRSWVTLYLASLTGLLWSSFLFANDVPVWVPYWIIITVAGLNLMVHLLRFDRINLTRRAPPRFAMTARRW